MVTALYASLSAFLLIWLTLNVIKLRQKNKISYGDGGNKELQLARYAHSNACEYLPIALLLLFALEYNKGNIWMVHLFGIVFISGRAIHALSFLALNHKGRVLGMKITIFTIIGLAICNLVYLPYQGFFKI